MKKTVKTSKKKVLFAVLAPLMAVAAGVSALVGAILGAGGNKRLPAGDFADGTTAVSSTTINLGTDAITTADSAAVQSLINFVNGTTTGNTSYNTLSNNIESWSNGGGVTKVKPANMLKGKTVTMGGIVWNVMYVSKADTTVNGTTAGDVIVTLWQADADDTYKSAYATTASTDRTVTYPSAMYGASVVRSTLVGSNYATSNTAMSTSAHANYAAQASHWSQFTSGAFSSVIATPANMKWQETQSSPLEMKQASDTTLRYPWRFPNDAYGNIGTNYTTDDPTARKTSSGAWYGSSATDNCNYYDNNTAAYTAWKNDKLWLPSMTETGWYDTNFVNKYNTAGSGLWNADNDQRKTNNSGTTQYAWLRSGNYYDANVAYLLNSSGSGNLSVCTSSYAVRPALHLNLKSAAQAAGLFEQPITYHTAYGTAPVDPDGKYVPGDATEKLLEVTNIPDGLEFAGWAKDSYSGTVITDLSAQNEELDLYATFKPKAASAAPTPADGILNTNYGATNVTLSAAISHTLLNSGALTVSTYWRYNDGSENIAASDGDDGIALTDGANPALKFARPTRARTGKYTLYYTLTPTAAEAAKGVKPLADQKVADFTLTVYGAVGTVAEKPTLDKSEIYVGQGIVGTQLVGGRVSCATANIDNVAGTWEITSEGVFTSSGKILAKFAPDDPDIAPIEDVEINTNAIQLTMKLNEDVTDIEGATAAADKSFNVDYGSAIEFAIEGNLITFKLIQDGGEATGEFTLSVAAGYTPYLHRAASLDPSKTPLVSGSSEVLKNVTSNKLFTASYQPEEVSYAVYYILDDANSGNYPAWTNVGDLDNMLDTNLVYKYEGTAFAGSAVVYLDESGKPLNSALASSADIGQRSLDTAKTGNLGRVKGDGSTVALVYLKLNEYVVTYSSAGASPSSQTKSLRYGAKLTEPATQPEKALSTFDYWSYDEAGEDRVDFTTATVTGNVTLYAQFITRQFHVRFDFNVGDGEYQIPSANSSKLAPIAGGNLHGNKVLWNVDGLFDNSFAFGTVGGTAGLYGITYTIDNVSSNKRINGIIPSAIGYTFGGWYEEGASRATTVIRTPNDGTAEVITLTARWTPTQYAIRFDPQNGGRVTSKTVRNITAWEDILPETPQRGGYKFLGWYVSNDSSPENENYADVEEISRSTDSEGRFVFSISDFVARGLFTTASTSVTLYAEWESMPVHIETVEDEDKGSMSFTMDGGDLSDTNPIVYIGREVEVKVEAKPGYRFKNLVFHLQNGTTEAFRDGVTTFTVSSRFVCKSTDDIGEEYSFIKIGAEYSEQRYTITYHTDGGRAEDTNFARSYSASELVENSANRAKLPSRLTKDGWDFAGWIFERSEEFFENPQYAHAAVAEGESYYGAELWLVQPYSLDNVQEKTYRNVILKAVWTPQEATVYLYNATYNSGDNIRYDYDSVNKYYYIDENDAGYPLVTEAKIDIANPVRDSFDFLGWATTRNGAVVYPAVEGQNFISYTVNPDHDSNGSALNRNNLYAVWHVKGVNYIIMSANNNGATYGGDGITMSARPAQNYTDNDANIRLNYYWYRVFEGMYDQCFTETDYVDDKGYMWYLDESGNIVTYEKDGKYYAEDKTTEISAPVGTKFTVKNFNSAAVGVYCEERFKRENVAASETPNVKVENVADSGIYICYVEVVATEGSGTTTRSGGYGEIEITMNKAVFGGLSMEDARVEYNAKSRADEIAIKGLVVSTENGLRTITLPDGSKVNVTYTYYLGAGELKENDPRQPITDLSIIKNVGEYHVVANFEFAVGGDKGNYEPLESLEADLYILADVLSVLEYQFTHDGVVSDATDFTGVYDGKAYGIDVVIKDTLSITAGSQPVTDVDDVAVDYKVYRVTENGDVEVPAANLPTVDAGTYAVVIVGLKGEASGNYILGPNVETRQEYTIEKQKYEAADHIHFNDVDNIVFDNEIHTLSVSFDEGYSLPDTVTATYTTEYIPEDSEFVNGRLTNNADDNNGGRYAGTYNITVTFSDSAAGNHEALESMSATLTIKKADFFEFYNVNGTDLLRDGGFVSRSTAFIVGKSYNPYISSGMLVDAEHFALTYTYYRVDANTQVRTELGSGTHEALAATGDLISLAGKYEIVAHITYNSPLYRNNFEETDENDCTITYEISGVPVESVEVVFKSGFEESGRLVMLGEGFDYSVIDSINVKYEGDAGTSVISGADDILLAGVRFEEKNGAEKNTFWHVGKFNVYVSFYETESVAYEFTVKEEITDFVLKYSNGGAYAAVPEDGLELLTDGRVYSFIIEYSCTGENGGIATMTSDAVVAESGLALGENKLGVSEEFYLFGDVAVDMYEVLSGVKWKYSTDGRSWTDVPENNELTYAGKVYQITAVYGEGANEKTFAAHTMSGADALNVGGYVMVVGRSGNYRIDEEYTFRIKQKKLAFVWDKNSFEYDMLSHTPAVVSSGVEEVDLGLVTFGFNYYDANKNRILSAGSIVTVGTYYVSVTLGGDLTARSNYTLDGATNAEYYEFAIVKADVKADVYYSESNYGRDVSYAGNTELRLNALKADFGENAQVAGQFRFIEPTEDSYTIIDGKSFADKLANSGELTVHYLYVPDNKNYNELTGTITINVQEPRLRTGEGALSVEFGNGAIQFYLVNQTLDTYGIEVYRLYESTYQENGVWYGARELVENPVFRLEGYNGSIDHYVISSTDLSGGKIVLIARDGSNSGKLDIPVIDKTATGIEIANPDEYRKTYYVGETPDFGDIVFRVLFGNDTPAVEVKIGTVKADFNRELTAEDTTFTVNFTYFSVSTQITFNVAPKEDLTVVKPTDTVLNYTGAEIAVPELKFTVDGKTYGQNELDGVEVKVSLYFGENNRPVTYILEEGKYSVVYEFDVTNNPRFNAHDPVNVEVEVTTNPYTVERTIPKNSQNAYTGKDIEVPKPTIGQVTDSTAGGETVPESRIIRVYSIFDEKENRTWEVRYDEAWTVLHSGRYVITVTVRVAQSGGAEPFTAWSGSYELVVTQAQNDVANASISGPDFVIKGADGSVDLDVFKATADFGTEDAENIVWEYSTSRDGGYSTTKPTAVGTYYVRARIIETDDYQGLTTLGKLFEIRNGGIDLGENGSISGENGVGDGWSLEIKHMEADAVSQVSINRQDVLDGYEVALKKANGALVSGEGEYTVRVKLSEELSGRTDLKVFFKDANGNTSEKTAKVVDGYVEFTTSEFGTFIITSQVAGAPVGLLVAVIVLAVVAAGMITACVIVFVKKKRKGAQ